MLVIGPNRVFLRYIERVLPSLGEAGVEQVVLADLVPDVRFGGLPTPRSPHASRATRACRTSSTRQSPIASGRCATTSSIPFRSGYVRLRADDSVRIVRAARRRFRRHNAGASMGRERGVVGDGGHVARRRRTGQRGPPGGAPAARDSSRARPHVAGADAGTAAARPVRIDGAAPARRRHACSTNASTKRCTGPREDAVGDVRWSERRRGAARRRPRGARSGPAAQRQGRRGRRDPHVRPHRHRRGAGPHADADADGGSAARSTGR